MVSPVNDRQTDMDKELTLGRSCATVFCLSIGSFFFKVLIRAAGWYVLFFIYF